MPLDKPERYAKMKQMSLNQLLLCCFISWAIAFYLVHGSVVLTYLALHLVTSGAFTLLMMKRMK